MKATVSSRDIGSPSVTTRGSITTIESFAPGGVVVRLEGLSARAGIKRVVEFGLAADNGDLYLLLEMKEGLNRTIRINSEEIKVMGDGNKVVKLS